MALKLTFMNLKNILIQISLSIVKQFLSFSMKYTTQINQYVVKITYVINIIKSNASYVLTSN